MIQQVQRSATRSRLFLYLSAFALGLVLFGFSFTYWGPVFEGAAFPLLQHVHAVLWFGWFGLFLTQALLVDRGDQRRHRTIGIATTIYTVGLVVVSGVLAVRAIVRDAHLITGGLESVPTIIPLSQIVMFSGFFIAAVVQRGRPSHHKRLLVLAALVGSTPALARISIGLLGAPNVPLIFAASNALVIGVAVADWRVTGRLHRVFLWGGLAVIAVRTARVPIAMSPVWSGAVEQLARLFQLA